MNGTRPLTRSLRLISVCLVALVVTNDRSPAAEPGLVNLGPAITPYAVSSNGAVVAGYDASQYFYWTEAGGRVGIGGSVPGGGVGGSPSISDDGAKIVGTALNSASSANEMSIYSVGEAVWTHLGGIGGQSGTEISSGYGISGDGEIAVGLGWVDAGGAHAIKWREFGGTVDLGSTVEGRSSRANAANGDGTFLGGWQDSETGFRQGAIWVHGSQVLIWNDPAETVGLGEVADVSGDGFWAVGSGVSANGWQPWRWNGADGAESLGHLDPAWRGAATAISFGGEVIVGFDRPFPGPATFGQGFVWTGETGMVDLNVYAADLGIDTQGVTLALPLGLSADGSTVVGVGRDGNSTVGWVLTLFDPTSTVSGDGRALAGSPVLSVAPNPFRRNVTLDLDMPGSGVVSIDVYDLGGRAVRRLLSGTVAPGRRVFEWDGKDDRGRELAAGTYFLRVVGSGVAEAHRVVRLD